MEYLMEHTALGFCWLDILPLLALAALAVWFFRKRKQFLQEEDELKKRIAAYHAADEEGDDSYDEMEGRH